METGAQSKRLFPKVVGFIGVAVFLGSGLWAMVAPKSFFETAATFEPYNQHFLQDIGAFMVGLGVVLLLALMAPRAAALGVALAGVGAGSAAHTISHGLGRNLGGNPSVEIPMLAVLTLLLFGAAALALKDPFSRAE
ncbi:MAG: hypothetical protein ACR2FO_04070 [Actinomycetota bacterium]